LDLCIFASASPRGGYLVLEGRRRKKRRIMIVVFVTSEKKRDLVKYMSPFGIPQMPYLSPNLYPDV
jgi:hypothetical protein